MNTKLFLEPTVTIVTNEFILLYMSSHISSIRVSTKHSVETTVAKPMSFLDYKQYECDLKALASI